MLFTRAGVFARDRVVKNQQLAPRTKKVMKVMIIMNKHDDDEKMMMIMMIMNGDKKMSNLNAVL